MLKTGQQAPDFDAQDQWGNTFKLSDFKGKKNVVLYFYPKDFTGGCTAEACSFRDNYELFCNHDTEVIGVSKDSDESHQRFATKYKLPFKLVADKKGSLNKLYEVPAFMAFIPGRVTFVINKEGVIIDVINALFDSEKHIRKSLVQLQKLEKIHEKSI